ncbi:hypothetical protein CKP88_24470 [Salmonella enterica]|nr:hypothetical protein [Salmonella enterica]EDK1677227.1 hypothetical protein [Salmonella enterica subsp. enterica serovar Muenchen]EBT2618386.1 hypothetical protein [Salmonella enterica]EBU0944920.1 hypothetical protein [Salmonella enterica]EDK2028313.1 hypothetical protein [Salmonella enterica subsp. enterica serovar Muenchen]
MSPVRRKLLLQQLREFHITVSSIAERIYIFLAKQRYAAEILRLVGYHNKAFFMARASIYGDYSWWR